MTTPNSRLRLRREFAFVGAGIRPAGAAVRRQAMERVTMRVLVVVGCATMALCCAWAGPAEDAAAALQAGIAAAGAGDLRQAAEAWTRAAPLFDEAEDLKKAALCWWNAGVAYDRLEQYEEAIRCFLGAVGAYERLPSRADQAAGLCRIAMDQWYLKRHEEALAGYEKALGIYVELAMEKEQADCHRFMGGIHQDRKRHAEAITCLRGALGIYTRLGMEKEQADCLHALGLSFWRLELHEEAIGQYEAALGIYERLGLEGERADCECNLGRVHTSLGQYERAMELFSGAAERYARLGNRRGEADCWRNIGVACRRLGLYDEAIAQYTRALQVYVELGLTKEEADCWTNMGVAHASLGEYQTAIGYYEQAMAAYEAGGQEEEEAACNQNLGVAYKELGQIEKAIECFDRALKGFEALGLEREQADCWVNIATAQGRAGRHATAADLYLRALELYMKLGLERETAQCRMNLATTYIDLRDYAHAMDHCEAALAVYEKLGLAREQADCWMNIGIAQRGRGDTEASLDALERACGLYRKLARTATGGGRRWAPEPLYRAEAQMAQTLRVRGRPDDPYSAYRHLARAVGIIEHLRARAASTTELRTAYFAAMSWVYDEIIDLLVEMQDTGVPLIAERMQEDEPGYWEDLGLPTPRLWADWGSYAEAILHYSDASRARVLQELLSNRRVALADKATSELHRRWTALMAQERDVDERLAAALGAGDEAQVVAWRERAEGARRQREQVERDLSVTRWGQVVQPRTLTLPQVRGLLGPGEALVEYKVLWDRIATVLVSENTIQVDTRNVSSGVERPIWGGGDELRTEEVLARLSELQQQAAEDGGLPEGVPGIAGPAELARSFTLAQLVWLYRRPMGLMSASDPEAAEQAEAQQGQQLRVAAALYQILLGHLEETLEAQRITALLVVPDGALYYLPFSALVRSLPADVDDAPGGMLCAQPGVEYVIDRWRTAVLPSAAMYAATGGTVTEGAPPRRLCVFADPVFAGDRRSGAEGAVPAGGELSRLAHTREEALEALAAFGSGPETMHETAAADLWGDNTGLIGLAAREAFAYAPELRDYGYLLLSTHGIILPDRPEYSYIALTCPQALGLTSPQASDDGRLMLPEAFGLDLNARMVTLSACRTAEGDYRKGEGILGLVAAMLVSGARAVTASLWSVDDRQTSRLMGEYHRRLGAGDAPADALRAAQLALLRAGREACAADPTAENAAAAHPYYWAPFVLMGQ